MKCRPLRNVVVRKSATVFELLAGKVRRSVARQEGPPCLVSSAWLDIESSTLRWKLGTRDRRGSLLHKWAMGRVLVLLIGDMHI
jgi:hypothetical protein